MQVLLLYTILPSFVLISAILATLRREGTLCPPVLQGSKKPGINRVKGKPTFCFENRGRAGALLRALTVGGREHNNDFHMISMIVSNDTPCL